MAKTEYSNNYELYYVSQYYAVQILAKDYRLITNFVFYNSMYFLRIQ